jgi:hypothetical protein
VRVVNRLIVHPEQCQAWFFAPHSPGRLRYDSRVLDKTGTYRQILPPSLPAKPPRPSLRPHWSLKFHGKTLAGCRRRISVLIRLHVGMGPGHSAKTSGRAVYVAVA